MRIEGRTALVTGASAGIGAATARALARKGARVLLLARTRVALEEVERQITDAGGEALSFPVDLSEPEAIEETSRAVLDRVGVPDLLVNNAGAGRWRPVTETSAEEAVGMMAVPYLAAFLVTRAFLGEMLRRGSGHIVNITSPAAYTVWPGATGYVAARWAMRGFSNALRADLRGTGIGVTLVVPGKVQSTYFENNPGTRERLPGIARLFRTLEPEDVAAALIRGVERERATVMLPLLLRVTVGVHRLVPGPVEWLIHRSSAGLAAERAS